MAFTVLILLLANEGTDHDKRRSVRWLYIVMGAFKDFLVTNGFGPEKTLIHFDSKYKMYYDLACQEGTCESNFLIKFALGKSHGNSVEIPNVFCSCLLSWRMHSWNIHIQQTK